MVPSLSSALMDREKLKEALKTAPQVMVVVVAQQ